MLKFSPKFSETDHLWADYIIGDNKVFPGATFLEMARAAVATVCGKNETECQIALQNVEWDYPIVTKSETVQLHIGLTPIDNENVEYEILFDKSAKNGIVSSWGKAVISKKGINEKVDIQFMLKRKWNKVTEGAQFYELLKNKSINLGPAYRVVDELRSGEGELLAKVSLPQFLSPELEEYTLHPSIMDAAFQIIAHEIASEDDGGILTPNKLKNIEFFSPFKGSMWVWLKFKASQEMEFDVEFIDTNGNVCARIKGLNLHTICSEDFSALSEYKSEDSRTKESHELMTFEEVWLEQQLQQSNILDNQRIICFSSQEENQKIVSELIGNLDQNIQLIFISESAKEVSEKHSSYQIAPNDSSSYKETFLTIKQNYGEIDSVLYLWPLENGEYHKYSNLMHLLQGAESAGLKIKKLLIAGEYEKILDKCYLDSWIGFERSINQVMPQIHIAVVFEEKIKNEAVPKTIIERIIIELCETTPSSVLYINNIRHVYKVRPMDLQACESVFRKNGTYLISGGCGGLGYMLSNYLVTVYQANLILVGRSAINEKTRTIISELEAKGGRVIYFAADVSNRKDVQSLASYVKQSFKKINGIIHAAGSLSARNVLTAGNDDFHQVLDSKIQGTILLDEIFKDEDLDFMCFFSSVSAVIGDFGSCDYSIGNRFQSNYAQYRNLNLNAGERKGKTVSILWPIWKEGGMAFAEDSTTDLYLQSSGQRPLEREEGLQIFERLLGQVKPCPIVINGLKRSVYRFFGINSQADNMGSDPITSEGITLRGRKSEMKGMNTEECVLAELKDRISKCLKIPIDKIGRDENLSDFGFDSISLEKFANDLSRLYEIVVTPSIFYSYATVAKLVNYFITNHLQKLEEFYSIETNQSLSPVLQSHINEIKYLKRKKNASNITRFQQGHAEPIAIVGMSGRFPLANNCDEMWQILADGRQTISAFPKDRLKGEHHEYSTWKCGCIEGIYEFDPQFFEISPREAELLDPRQRLLLEESWKALEHAGYGSDQIKNNKIGMFVGVEQGNYPQLVGDEAGMIANHDGVLAARLAYFLDFKGPVFAINTACSSGLVALHQACLNLNSGECDTAIVAAANLIFDEGMFEVMGKAGMLSKDGKCYAFDKKANGLVAGEAVVVIVLKKLSRANDENDTIYSTIKGSGINYDGKTNGITTPNGLAQTELIKGIYEKNRINPANIEYIIAHGTGTRLGDPVEVNALIDVYKQFTNKQSYCALTSSKTNFGHTFAASGLVSIINLVQSFKHKLIPASLNCNDENDFIAWSNSPFFVNKTNKIWEDSNDRIRLGAVSSFGISGTNAHVVLESHPNIETCNLSNEYPFFLLPLSAKSQQTLECKIHDMSLYLEKKVLSQDELLSLSYTLIKCRHHFNHRFVIVAKNYSEALEAFKNTERGEEIHGAFRGKVSREFAPCQASVQKIQELCLAANKVQTDLENYLQKLHSIADYYCQGFEIPWDEITNNKRPPKMELPTYPFANNQYCISKTRKQHNSKIQETQCEPNLMVQQAPSTPIKIYNSLEIVDCVPDESRIACSAQVTDATSSSGLSVVREEMELITKPFEQRTAKEILNKLKNLLANVLYVNEAEIELEAKFIELGMDSIIAVEWIKLINSEYGTSIAATRIYDFPNIIEFSKFLAEEVSAAQNSENDKTYNEISDEPGAASTEELILKKIYSGEMDIEEASRIIQAL